MTDDCLYIWHERGQLRRDESSFVEDMLSTPASKLIIVCDYSAGDYRSTKYPIFTLLRNDEAYATFRRFWDPIPDQIKSNL